jgi:hypothetical protein
MAPPGRNFPQLPGGALAIPKAVVLEQPLSDVEISLSESWSAVLDAQGGFFGNTDPTTENDLPQIRVGDTQIRAGTMCRC